MRRRCVAALVFDQHPRVLASSQVAFYLRIRKIGRDTRVEKLLGVGGWNGHKYSSTFAIMKAYERSALRAAALVVRQSH